MDIEDLKIRLQDGEVIVTLSVRAASFSHFQEFEGCGDTLSDAFLDLSEQLCDAGQ